MGIVTQDAVVCFIRGCITRERERLARIFESTIDPKALAQAIRDASKDDQVFEWIGPGKRLG